MAEGTKPQICVIMPAYNAEQYISAAIRSVQAQTFCDWELIVLDDASTDGTAQTVQTFVREDPRIRLYTNRENIGVARSRNRGLELRRGDWVAFLDSDDMWRPEKLSVQLACMEKTGADLVYTSYAITDTGGRKCCRDYIVPASITLDGLLKENVIGCSSVLLSPAAAKKSCFREEFFHEDYILWLELLRSGCKAVGVEQVTVDYLYHADSKTGNKYNAARKRWAIYRNYMGFSRLKSARYFASYGLAALRKYKRT